MLALVPLLLSAPAQADRYSFDDSAGSIKFHMVATLHEIEGAVQSFSGEIFAGEEKETPASLTIQTSSLTTHLGIRDGRMHEYVMGVESFPTLKLDVHSITGKDLEGFNAGEGSGTIMLNGKMTIRSSTRDVSIPTIYTVKDGAMTLKGEYAFEWPAFNLPDPSIAISTLQPKIEVAFDVSAKKSP